ncbi:unnamed protein product [Parajaminaea phylloscopi]
MDKVARTGWRRCLLRQSLPEAALWKAGRKVRPRCSLASVPFAGVQARFLVTTPPSNQSAPVALSKSEKAPDDQAGSSDLLVNAPDVRVGPGVDFKDHLRHFDRKGITRYFAARLVRNGKVLPQAYSLRDDIPPGADQIKYISLTSDDPSARRAFWLTSAYLLGAALTNDPPHGYSVLMAGQPRLLEDSTAGGSGFAYDYVLVPETAEALPVADGYHGALQQLADFVNKTAVRPMALARKDMKGIDSAVADLATRNVRIDVRRVSQEEASDIFASNPLKVEWVLAAPRPQGVRIIDVVCPERGIIYTDLAPRDPTDPLLSNARSVMAFQLTEWSTGTLVPTDPSASVPLVAAAEAQPALQQPLSILRGISFPSKMQLKSHIEEQRLAVEASHHNIGRAQSLFVTNAASPGSPLMLPHGVRLGRKMERVIRDLYDVYGYDEVITPQVYKRQLWERSGHWDNYRADMFSVEGFAEKEAREARLVEQVAQERSRCCASHSEETQVDGQQTSSAETGAEEEFGLKPMNCPGHCLIFASRPRSLKHLPIRYSEWSPLHRNESSGSLSGLTRVRRFHQDDAHVFCAPEQVESEIREMLEMLRGAYDLFGFPRYELVLSTRPPNFIGSVQEWDRAEASLRQALDSTGMSWDLNEADGAFYGPKIDVRLVDNVGRKHQTATIQLDFQLPQRFDLTYDDGSNAADDASKPRPVMIHRAILGSVERFMAILIESTRGRWPFWLSPRQACVIPVSSSSPELVDYAHRVAKALSVGTTGARESHHRRHLHKFHVDVDASADTLSKRVRRAQTGEEAYNFVVIVGDKEREAGASNVPAQMPISIRARPVLPPEVVTVAMSGASDLLAEDRVEQGTASQKLVEQGAAIRRLATALDRRGNLEGAVRGGVAEPPTQKGVDGLHRILGSAQDGAEGQKGPDGEWQWTVEALRDTWVLMDDYHL